MELSTTTLSFIAIIAIFGLVGLVAVDVFMLNQDTEARGCENGLPNSAVGINASQGRCFGH